MKTHPLRALAAPPGPRRGASLPGLLFGAVGAAIFFVPFLRSPDAPSWIGEDFSRAETDVPFEEDVALVEEELDLQLADAIRDGSAAWFGTDSESFRATGLVELERLESGARVYETQCLGCHGTTGDGGGPAARFLDPRPRNFRRGTYKFTSTPSGAKPLRRDLMTTVANGLSGSAMPGFPLMSMEKRRDVVEYVRYLSMRGEFEQLFLDIAYDDEEVPDAAEVADLVYERWSEEAARVVYPSVAETERDQASIERGREVFLDANLTQCDSCHGAEGRGDGINADAYEDDWGYKIVPRDFTRGVFRAGETPEDLWRSIATGINGTPMGSFADNLTGEQIWDLVHYVQYLADQEEGTR